MKLLTKLNSFSSKDEALEWCKKKEAKDVRLIQMIDDRMLELEAKRREIEDRSGARWNLFVKIYGRFL